MKAFMILLCTRFCKKIKRVLKHSPCPLVVCTLLAEKDNALRVRVMVVMFHVQAKRRREDFLEEVTTESNSDR